MGETFLTVTVVNLSAAKKVKYSHHNMFGSSKLLSAPRTGYSLPERFKQYRIQHVHLPTTIESAIPSSIW